MREQLHLVVAGHVDHGKSTVVGRLLADTGSLPDGKLEQVRALCARTARPFEYAFLLDALRDERAQGITIDTARVFFRTPRRDTVILDAPGHVEFVRNMVTGASRAEAALLVIDAHEGVRENTRRHGFLMALLGLRQLAVVVNKMDLAGWDHATFGRLVSEYRAFLRGVGVEPLRFIPASALEGENLVAPSARMPWYEGPTVLDQVEAFQPAPPPVDRPFRLPVQDVFKFTEGGDRRRIVAGTVESGEVAAGDEVVFYPSGKRATVRSLEAFGRPAPERVRAGETAGFTLDQQLYLTRGELATRAGEPRPEVTSRLRASVFWLGREPLVTGRDYLLRLGTARVPMRVEAIHHVFDTDNPDPSGVPTADPGAVVGRHRAADVTLQLARAIAFDLADDLPATGRFVIVDGFEIQGGGTVRAALPDRPAWAREKVLLRNWKWEPSFIAPDRRAERLGQSPLLLLLTGPADGGDARKRIARDLEARLFESGRQAYFLGIGNVLYGVDADLERRSEQRAEHMRRLAEVAHLMLDAGTILVVTAAELTPEDLEVVATGVEADRVVTAWLGGEVTTGLGVDLMVEEDGAVEGLAGLVAARSDRPSGPPGARLRPAVLWFTGLSGAGKSTIADRVAEEIRRRGHPVERLDGDTVRAMFPGTGFSREERNDHIRRVGYLASTLERHGVFVVASFISPYEESRRFVRGLCRRFVEVYVNTPLEECERRDVKGLYARARRGELPQFTGVSDPYEPPPDPEVVVDATGTTPDGAARQVFDYLWRHARS